MGPISEKKLKDQIDPRHLDGDGDTEAMPTG